MQAHGIFTEAYGIFFVVAHGLFVVALGLLSSCGLQAFSSLVAAWVPEHVGSVVCGTHALSLRCASSVVVARGLS